MASERPKFTFLGHSTVVCDLPTGERILIEPWVAGNPSCTLSIDQLERVDAILITHGHQDHMGDAVEIAKHYQPEKVVATYEICVWLESKGVGGCSPMNIGGSQQVLGTTVTQVHAQHTSSLVDGSETLYAGVASGFVVQLPGGYTFYHAGDTGLFSDLRLIAEIYRPELAFLPIGDCFTMGPELAARACEYLEVRQVIPIHWGTFPLLTGTPARFEQALDERGVACQVVHLEPGDSW